MSKLNVYRQMSKLNVYHHELRPGEYAEFYLKYEADKVIAELQKQVHDYAQGLYVIQARAEKELRYHKYRRCLAMAEICRHEWCTIYYERKKYSENKFLDHLMSKKNRHKEKWLELAEKFKEAK